MRKLFFVLSIFAVVVACNKDYDKIDEEKIADYITAKGLTTQVIGNGVHYIVEKEGNGEYLKATDEIAIKYKGFFLDDEQFDAADSLILYVNEQIDGWVSALPKFKEGGKGKLIVPSSQAFGPQGVSFNGSRIIPKNAVLVYDIEIKKKNPVAQKNIKELRNYIKAKGLKVDSLVENGLPLYYTIDEAGTGNNPSANSQVNVKYKGYLMDGKVFDENKNGVSFSLNNVIRGWQLGIPVYKKGGKGKLLMPSRLAYYRTGAGADIPPYTPLIFDVELVNF